MVFRVAAHPHNNRDQAASADAALDRCSSAEGPLVVVAPAVVPLASAPPGVAFIDGSVKPPVNDGTRQVGHLVQLRTDAVPNLRPVGLSRRRNLDSVVVP